MHKLFHRYVVGLYNTGNSCFINAALQILLNCPTLMQFFGEQCREFIGLDVSESGSAMGQRSSTQQPNISENFLGLVQAISGPDRYFYYLISLSHNVIISFFIIIIISQTESRFPC